METAALMQSRPCHIDEGSNSTTCFGCKYLDVGLIHIDCCKNDSETDGYWSFDNFPCFSRAIRADFIHYFVLMKFPNREISPWTAHFQ